MNLNNYKWSCLFLIILAISLTLYALPTQAKTSRNIYYYNNHTGTLALEEHRLNWSTNLEKNICATVREQLLPAYSHDAITLDHSMQLDACLVRNRNVYLNFIQSAPLAILTQSDEEDEHIDVLDMVYMAVRINHRYIRQISISVDGLPRNS